MKKLIISFTVIALTTLTGCQSLVIPTNKTAKVITPVSGAKLPHRILKKFKNGLEIRNGGFGSAATAHPTKSDEFYAMTDRGPNIFHPKGKWFPIPNFSPTIRHYRLLPSGKIEVVKTIVLKQENGKSLSGIPNPKGYGATGETPYSIKNKKLNFDKFGLDTEGLVATKSGEFWVSDEYGPHIVHFTADGRELERISPIGLKTTGRKIPAVFAKRRPNRGMEGLAITPNGKTLVGVMQSTLNNPSKSKIKNKSLTRILTFDLATGKTKQYLYRQDKNNLSNSEIVALTNSTFLVLERDGTSGLNSHKKIYKISLKGATDVSSLASAPKGKLVNGKTLEQLSWKELKAKGIKPVKKVLSVDLVKTVNYQHDKAEGFWLINDQQIGVINDDDFAIVFKNKKVVQKKLSNGSEDAGRLYIVNYK